MTDFAAWFIGFYIWHCLGITIGYHRLLSHRAFSCPRIVEYFFVIAGYLAWQGSPIWWATIHRAHHKQTDTALDPHSPKFGFFRAYMGWMLKAGYNSNVDPISQSPDLVSDPIYRFLERKGDLHSAHALAFIFCCTFRLILLAVFGWTTFFASIAAWIVIWIMPLLLNVVCHIPKLGYRSFATADDSVNVWWVGLLAMGEGWHNNHHACPGSARTGLRPHELDISWLTILTLSKLNLAKLIKVSRLEDLELKYLAKEDASLPVL